MRRFAFLSTLLCLALFVSSPVHADENGARQFIDGLGQQVLALAKDSGKSDSQKQDELRNIFFQSVDVDWIARFVLGRFWRTASESQQQTYLNNYRNFISTNYTSRLRDYTGETFKITGARDDGDGKYMVSMQIVRPNGQNVETDYKVKEDGGYKIIDIVVEGVSLITTQRSEFSSAVSRKGLDFLIEQLAKKAANPQPAEAGKP
ncbi:MAG: ABC transporter substrate-binding protein [Rickettsiales bacterium]